MISSREVTVKLNEKKSERPLAWTVLKKVYTFPSRRLLRKLNEHNLFAQGYADDLVVFILGKFRATTSESQLFRIVV